MGAHLATRLLRSRTADREGNPGIHSDPGNEMMVALREPENSGEPGERDGGRSGCRNLEQVVKNRRCRLPNVVVCLLIIIIIIFFIFFILFFFFFCPAVVAASVKVSNETAERNHVNSTAEHVKNVSEHYHCGGGWLLHKDKCFFVSEVDETGHSAHNKCVSLNSTLAVIENDEKAFALYIKGEYDCWIGQRKGPNGELTWPDGSTLSNRTDINKGSKCRYLNHKDFTWGKCSLKRRWMCTKPALSVKKKPNLESNT